MTFIAFDKASGPVSIDDLRIQPAAVLYVEASRPDLVGHTTIHMLGQGTVVNAVTESIGTVVSAIYGAMPHDRAGARAELVAAQRHYLAPQPEGGASTVYISSANVSYIRPNLPAAPDFWYIRFIDGSELRIVDPLPEGLK